MKKQKEPKGFTSNLASDGVIFYFFNANRTNLREIIEIEKIAQIKYIKRKEHLFKLYKVDSIDYVVISLN